MYIKSIVLDGFKSYGQRTEITGFDKQFNAITGLNGSGKSNILDSICFVLGISNLSHVRVGNLQDLIYKSGQCGIDKATVSIIFDNTNPEQCPPGFEDIPEITISRQIVLGGKIKYMINGSTVQNKKIQDLFCSVQLNVNNPHFLVMQGKITKVLNMKPSDILAMVEEAAGIKTYERKKETTLKTIEKKEAKLIEIKLMINELEPKFNKLRTERAAFMEYKNAEKELEQLMPIYEAWECVVSKRKCSKAKEAVEEEENRIKRIESDIIGYENEIDQLEKNIEELSEQAKAEGHENLQRVEGELKSAEKSQARINASIKSLDNEINNETKKKSQLEKNLIDDEKDLKYKESELAKVQNHFEALKEADELDTKASVKAQKIFEALSAGMELNEDGQAETLMEQLIKVREEIAKVDTESKQSFMRLKFCQDQLKEKQKQRSSDVNELTNNRKLQESTNEEIKNLEWHMNKLNFDENRLNELQMMRRKLTEEIRILKDKVDNFEVRRPYTQFRYRDPEPNFDRNGVYGVVCRLIKVKNEVASVAIETAAGGRLYNVVIDSDVTGKKLLEHGDLQQRTTFIPINKIRANKMTDDIVKLAQNLVGEENCQPAIAHLSYDGRLRVVMEFIFGNVFVCKDMDVAKQVAFNDRIKRKCVTLDGQVCDPAGTLSGGAPQEGGSVLRQLDEIKQTEEDLCAKEQQLQGVDAEIRELSSKRTQYENVKQQLQIKQHELDLLKQRLQETSHYRLKEEIANLQKDIERWEEKIGTCKENEINFKEKERELESRMNSNSSKDDQIKRAEAEMKRLKAKSDRSRKEWKQREQDYATFKLEIEELKKSIEVTKEEIKTAEEAITNFRRKIDEIVENSKELNENIAGLQAQVKQEKEEIVQKNKDIRKKAMRKDELQNKITDCQVKLKEHSHKLKKLKEDYKNLKTKQSDFEKRVKESKLKEAELMSEREGEELEKKFRKAEEMKNSLGRTINIKSQTYLEQKEKEYDELKRKRNIIEQDKRKLLQVIELLDKKLEEVLTKAYDQISKDFGSIFSTLLPGANAKLVPPTGQTIRQGLEVKVSLGGVWKESLTELSGGQRSLAALSLILAMLLFKPAPLYILDEVDAALDLSHTQNIGNMLKTHFKQSQFIIVSLKDGMFSNANVLFRTQFVDGVSTITRSVNKNA